MKKLLIAATVAVLGVFGMLYMADAQDANVEKKTVTKEINQWCTVITPESAKIGDNVEVKVVLKGVKIPTKLSCHLHFGREGGIYGGFWRNAASVDVTAADGTFTFKYTLTEKEGAVKAIPTIFLSPDGDWKNKTANCAVSFPVSMPSNSAILVVRESPTSPATASGWVNISESFTQKIGVHDISATYIRRCLGMIVVPTGDIFIQTGKGVGVSSDQGSTWSLVEGNNVSGRCATGFSFSYAYPYDGRIAFFCFDGNGGITLDGGKTWRPFGKLIRMFEFADVDWSTKDPQTIFGMLHEPYYTVLSTDGGKTWQQLYKDTEEVKTEQVKVSKYHFGVINANTLVRSHMEQEGISMSTDAGKTWNEVAKYKVLGRRPVHYGNKVFWTASEGVISTTDGKEWTLTGKGPEKAVFGPYFGNSDQDFMVVSDKAFFITNDGGKTWKDAAPVFFPPDAPNKGIYATGMFNYFGWDSKRNILYASSKGGSVYKFQLK